MRPMLSYLIIIAIQAISLWEFVKWDTKEFVDEGGLWWAVLILGGTVLGILNWVLYCGGLYKLPWAW